MIAVIQQKISEPLIREVERSMAQPTPQDALLSLTMGALLVFILLMTGSGE